MGEVVAFPESHLVIRMPDGVHALPVLMIKRIMSGELSIAECDDPELTARILAAICLDYLDQ